MKALPILLLTGGGLFLWNKLRKAGGLADIAKQVTITAGGINLRQTTANLFSTTIYPEIIVTNPTQESAVIDSISGELFMNGSSVGTYFLSQIPINPGANTIELPVTLNNAGTLTAIVLYFSGINKNANLKFRTIGSLNEEAVNVTFDESYTLDLNKLNKKYGKTTNDKVTYSDDNSSTGGNAGSGTDTVFYSYQDSISGIMGKASNPDVREFANQVEIMVMDKADRSTFGQKIYNNTLRRCERLFSKLEGQTLNKSDQKIFSKARDLFFYYK